ncbi:MAG TPA: hypothetical protein VI874_03615, partial [Candidatus Norongarragalinales archaeon]|nr:hypothetical protein [Candidatus Norongarragalinales archaeon]
QVRLNRLFDELKISHHVQAKDYGEQALILRRQPLGVRKYFYFIEKNRFVRPALRETRAALTRHEVLSQMGRSPEVSVPHHLERRRIPTNVPGMMTRIGDSLKKLRISRRPPLRSVRP